MRHRHRLFTKKKRMIDISKRSLDSSNINRHLQYRDKEDIAMGKCITYFTILMLIILI